MRILGIDPGSQRTGYGVIECNGARSASLVHGHIAVRGDGLNVGLFLMFLTGLLPIGLLQIWNCYDLGFWWGRSAGFYELPMVQLLGFWRVVPDTIIIVLGAFPLLYFLLTTYPRLRVVGETSPAAARQE